MEIKSYIEAILHTSPKSLTVRQIWNLLIANNMDVNKSEVTTALKDLEQEYLHKPYELKKISNGYRLQLKSDYFQIVQDMLQLSPPKLSAAATETLALIAYRQPVTRTEIEQIRGVSVSSYIIKTLTDLAWIKVVGHKDCPGRPAMFATTKDFLEHFALNSISDLPPVFTKIESSEITT